MTRGKIIPTMLFGLAAFAAAGPPPNATINPWDPWAKIKPSDTLDWQKCFTNSTNARNGSQITCARLIVPLDHDNHEDNRTMQLPIVRVSPPSGVERTVFWNLGGPGLNAVGQLPGMSDDLLSYVGNDTALIAIAPRGTNGVTPTIECFQREQEGGTRGPGEAMVWDAYLREDLLNPELSDATLKEAWAAGRAYGMNCKAGAPSLLPYASTYHTAKDMDFVRRALNMEKLSFLGHSYGTILGATYANLFPNRVDRMVLDGVASYNWFKTVHTPAEVVSGAENVLEMFFEACWRAGSKKCALWDEDAAKIRERFNAVGPTLRKRPFIAQIEEASKSRYVAVSEWSWNNWVNVAVHMIVGFSQMAEMAVEILHNTNFTEQNSTAYPSKTLRLPWNDTERYDLMPSGRGARRVGDWESLYGLGESKMSAPTYLINCADRGGLDYDLSPDEIRSRLLGDPENDSIILEPQIFNLFCAAGNFPVKGRPRDFVDLKTSGRILFVGNTADPVTPIYNARKFHEAFTNSGLLTIDGAGHCASNADPTGECIREYIQPYFQYGEMPPEGTVCKGFKELLDAESM